MPPKSQNDNIHTFLEVTVLAANPIAIKLNNNELVSLNICPESDNKAKLFVTSPRKFKEHDSCCNH